jgi:hypothetical protein
MADQEIRAWLSARTLVQLRANGHNVPRIRWEADGMEASGTCTRCGDGVLLYYDPQPDRCSIEGTAITTSCPGEGCEHGWCVVRRGGVGVVLQCAHCGAQRSEADESAATDDMQGESYL